MITAHPNKIEGKGEISSFLMAGKAKITLKNTKSGNHFTYQVKKAKDAEIAFVALLGGKDNTSDYRYLGILPPNPTKLVLTKASKVTLSTPSVKALNFLLEVLSSPHNIPPALEVWHEGYCGRCGRLLTVPESIACGLGPKCASKA